MGWAMEAGTFDVQQAWVDSAADGVAWLIFGWGVAVALLLFVASWALQVRRRSFRCEHARRDVEVEFEECGLPGFRRRTAVQSCSAFDPPTCVTCRRHCLASYARVRVSTAGRLP